MRLELPFPPSINHYYVPTYSPRTRKSFIRLGKEAIAYRNAVVSSLKGLPTIDYDVHLTVILHASTNHRRDLDNYDGKAILDALTHAKVWKDDSQVKSRYSEWGEQLETAKVMIEITRK